MSLTKDEPAWVGWLILAGIVSGLVGGTTYFWLDWWSPIPWVYVFIIGLLGGLAGLAVAITIGIARGK